MPKYAEKDKKYIVRLIMAYEWGFDIKDRDSDKKLSYIDDMLNALFSGKN